MSDKQYDNVSLTLIIALIFSIIYMFWAFIAGAFEKHKTWVYSIAINNRDIIASASENEINIWENRYCIDKLIGHNGAIKSVAFSQSGKYIASGSIDQSVKVWSLSEEKEIRNLHQHTAGVNKVFFSTTDDYIISAGYDDKLIIWDWKDERIVKELAVKHTEIAISKLNMLAYIDADCSLNLYNLNKLTKIDSFKNNCGVPKFHPDGNIIAVKMDDAKFKFIDSRTGQVLSQLQANLRADFGIYTFTPNGKFLIVGLSGGDIEVWDWQERRLVNTFTGHNLTSINDFNFTNDNELISASGDRSVRIWDFKSGTLMMRIGDGLFRTKFIRFLSVLVWFTLTSGFLGVYINPKNKFSSFAIISILSIWSAGLFWVLYYTRSYLTKAATTVLWITTVVSGLWVLTLYGAVFALFTIPIGLFFGYINIISDNERWKTPIPIILNLIFLSIICFSGIVVRLI